MLNKAQFENMLSRTKSVTNYIEKMSLNYRPKYLTRRAEYSPNHKVLEEIKKIADQFVIVAIGAEWCKDCVTNIPVLELIQEATGLRIYVLGGVKTDPLNPNKQWAVPPSPPEVETLKIVAVPTILIYTLQGMEIGRISENPEIKPTLEEELLYHMNRYLP